MIVIPGVFGFFLGVLLPRSRACVAAVAVWAAIATIVAVAGLADDGSFLVPAAIALVLTLILTLAGTAVRTSRQRASA